MEGLWVAGRRGLDPAALGPAGVEMERERGRWLGGVRPTALLLLLPAEPELERAVVVALLLTGLLVEPTAPPLTGLGLLLEPTTPPPLLAVLLPLVVVVPPPLLGLEL